MKRTIGLLILVLLLTAVAVYFFVRKSNRPESLTDLFAVSDIGNIDSIRLDKSGSAPLLLRKISGNWTVSGGLPVRPQLIGLLLDAIEHVTVLAPATKAARENVLREMMQMSVHVSIWGNGRLVKSYFVGGPTLDNKGTYMIAESESGVEEEVYITYIPGFNGFLTSRFNTDAELWRSRDVFTHRENQIDTLRVLYPAEPRKSFEIFKTDTGFFLASADPAIQFPYQPKRERIREFLSGFQSLALETYDNQYSRKDSLIQTTPFCTIALSSSDGKKRIADIYYMPVNKRSKQQYDEKGREVLVDVDRLFVNIDKGSDFGVLQYFVWGKVLRSYADFYTQPAVSQP